MAFNLLPIELNQEIARYLTDDKDLCAFAATCVNSHDAIHSDGGSFWRRRFKSAYALAVNRNIDNKRLKRRYQKRKMLLKRINHMRFGLGNSKEETKALSIIRILILESFVGETHQDDYGRATDLNMCELKEFALRHPDMGKIWGFSPTGTARDCTNETYHWGFASIQLMCAHLFFDVHNACSLNALYNFPDSQRMVYETMAKRPIFTGPNRNIVDMEFLLHFMNFFRYHMMRGDDSYVLKEAYKDLRVPERVQPWTSHLSQNGQTMPVHWKGTYAYLEHNEIQRIRSKRHRPDDIFLDKNVDGSNSLNPIQHMSFTDEVMDSPLRARFAEILKPIGTPIEPKTRAQRREQKETPPVPCTPLSAFGRDDDEFMAFGWITLLPIQEGIPGWKRLTFVKYYEDENGDMDYDSMWAYEGVVLPGGKIVLGRWWSYDIGLTVAPEEDENMYSGPFILWNVDTNPLPLDMDDGEHEWAEAYA